MPGFIEAVENFRRLQAKYAAFGASDTEPRAEFYQLVRARYDGQEVSVPDTARGWQLFSDMDGSDVAARELCAAARGVLEAANSDMISVARWLRTY
jgi:hypothetical protein